MMLLAVYALVGLFALLGALSVTLSPVRYTTGLSVLILSFTGLGLLLTATAPGMYYNHDGYFGDLWTATETINKTAQGLLSSVDYFNPIGPAYSWVYGLILSFDAAPSVATILHASALAAVIIMALSLLILRQHMSLLGLSIIVLSVVGVAVSGRGNGEILHKMPMHYLAPYNRWGWALFIPVAVRLALPQRHDKDWDLLGDVALGIAIALLLMLKVTYGAAALGLVAARILIVSRAWRQVGPILGGCAAVLLSAELIAGQTSAYLADLATAAALPESGLRFGKLFGQLGEAALFSFVALVVYLGALSREASWSDLRPIVLILLVAGAGCAVLMQNHYSVEAAVYPLLPLIALEWTRRLHSSKESSSLQERSLIAGAVAMIVFFPVVDVSMHLGQRIQFASNAPDLAFSETAYADLRFEPYLVALETSRLNTVSDGHAGLVEGLEMLRANGADLPGSGTVAALNFANPFPMLLGQPSPPGTPIWLHEGRSYSRDRYVAGDVFFEDVNFVMQANGDSVLGEIYGEVLTRDFALEAQGNYWTLFVRR